MTEQEYQSNLALLQSRLSDYRLRHSLGVMREAEELARLHGADPERAKLAGMMHDMTKEFSREEHFRLFEEYHVPLDENLRTNKNLWHAVSASCDIRKTLGVTDPDVISAIRYHTTGRAGMTLPETILYVADLTEPNRDYPDVGFYRALARENLSAAALLAMEWCIADLRKRGLPVHEDTLDGARYLRERYPDITEETEKRRLNSRF